MATGIDLSSLVREAFAEATEKPQEQVPQADIEATLATLATYGIMNLSSLRSVRVEALDRPLDESKNLVAMGILRDKLAPHCKKTQSGSSDPSSTPGAGRKMGSIIDGGKAISYTQDSIKEFVDRENEVAFMARQYAENLEFANRETSSTHPPVLLTSSQMYGSGKTFLGNHFLWKLRDSVYNQSHNLKEEYGVDLCKIRQKGLNLLLKSVYVYVDLRDRVFTRELGVDKFLRNSCLPEIFSALTAAKEDSYWAPIDVPYELQRLNIQDLKEKWRNVDYDIEFGQTLVELEKDTGIPLFIHIDEVDQLLAGPPEVTPLSKSAVDIYYAMWKVLTPVMKRTWCSFFCTGRSSLLNSIGRQLYHDIGIFSTDGRTEQVLIPNFHSNHIITMLSSNKLRFKSPEAKKELAKYIYKRTLGIPRLVYYCILYLEEYFEGRECTNKDITVHLLGQKFIDFGKRKGGGKEFDPLKSLPQELHQFYTKFVRFAALQIPLKLDDAISPTDFGLGLVQFKLITQEVLRVYNLHIGKYGEFWKITIPPVILDTIAKDHLTKFSPTAFWNLQSTPLISEDAFGPALEATTLDCLMKRLERVTPFDLRDAKWDDVLVFLKGSFFGSTKAMPLAYSRWPKMVSSIKAAAALDTISQPAKAGKAGKVGKVGKAERDKRAKREKKIENFFDGTATSSVEVNRQDWQFLLEHHMKPNILYRPAAKSLSADKFIYGIEGNSLHLQDKAGLRKIVTLDVLASEAPLAADGIKEGTFGTLLIVSMCVDEAVQTHKEAVKVVHDDVTIAVRFEPGKSLGEYTIPPYMDIVVLLEVGVNMLITKQNADLIRGGVQDPQQWLKQL